MSCAGGSGKRKVLGPRLTSTGVKLVPTGWELAAVLVPIKWCETGSAKWGGGGESSGEGICIWCVMLL